MFHVQIISEHRYKLIGNSDSFFTERVSSRDNFFSLRSESTTIIWKNVFLTDVGGRLREFKLFPSAEERSVKARASAMSAPLAGFRPKRGP